MTTYLLRVRVCWLATLLVAWSMYSSGAPIHGQVINWNNPAGGSYNTAANWNPANVPNTAAETANFNSLATFTVTFAANSNTTIDDLLVSAGDVTFSNAGVVNDATLNVSDDVILNGGDLTLTRVGATTADVNLIVTGDLVIQNGSDLKIRKTALVQTDFFRLSSTASSSSLEISEGGDLTSFLTYIGESIDSNAAVTVTGSGSTWTNSNGIQVGFSGTGSLSIADGAVVSSLVGVIGSNGNGGLGTVTITGEDSSWTTSAGFSVGLSGTGTMLVEAGGSLSNHNGTVGNATGTGSATIRGMGSTWTNTGTLAVGDNGLGTLVIEAGGSVSNALNGHIARSTGSNGTVTVKDAGSTWTNSAALYVGGSALTYGVSATLNIETGGTVDVGTTVVVLGPGTVNLLGGELATDQIDMSGGDFNFYFGTLRLTSDQTLAGGNGLTQALGDTPLLKVGQHLAIEGTATLLTQATIDGGTFSAEQLVNAQLLDLRRGTLNLTNQAITIGPAGPFGDRVDLSSGATINVALGTLNQGLVTGDGTFGGTFENDTTGEVRATAGHELRFTGPGNVNRGQINLFGGTLEITQALANDSTGFISGNGTLIVAAGLTNAGVLNLSSTANVSGDLTNSASGLVISAGGTTTFFDDVENNGEIRTSANSFTVYYGSYSGDGDTGPGTVIMEGDLKPGFSPGLTEFAGDLVFGSAASLNIEIGGTIPGTQYDKLVVNSDLVLDGDLNVTLFGGFNPVAGESFNILDWGSVSGTFDAINLPTITGLYWNTSQLYTTGTISIGLPGDFDLDGDVDGRDFLIWQRGGSPSPLSGGDLADWQANYGVGPLTAASVAVPEPTTAVCALLMALAIAYHRGGVQDNVTKRRIA